MFDILFNRKGLTLDRLRVIIELADQGTLAKAAGGNQVLAAQKSRQLKELEAFFGAELTRRQGRRLELTEQGLELAQTAREMLLRFIQFYSDCRHQPAVLRIGSGSSNLKWLLLPLAPELQRKLPAVRLVLRNSRTIPLVEDLREMRVDLAIVRENAVTSPLMKKRLTRLTYSLFVPPELMPKGTPPEARQLLASLPVASLGGGGEFHRTLEAAFRSESLQPNLALQCESFTDAHHALMTRSYAAILPSSAERATDLRDFIRLPLPFLRDQERVLCLAWNPRMAAIKPALLKVANILGHRLCSDWTPKAQSTRPKTR